MMDFKEEKISKILFRTFIEIIPSMMSSYEEEKNEESTTNCEREFTLRLVDSFRDKLDKMYQPEEV